MAECGCREYASPSLSWSKVGVVLHLQWREEDGTLFTIDCDLNCPTWPTHTRYDGSIVHAKKYLTTERPVGWLEELSKLEDMFAAGAAHHLLALKVWPVKFRMINRDTILPSQVTTPRDEFFCKQMIHPHKKSQNTSKLAGGQASQNSGCHP